MIKGINKAENYSVNEEIWLATAGMTMEILEKSKYIDRGIVGDARVSWWCCTDHPQAIHFYLRAKGKSEDSSRRLNSMNPNNDKTFPQELNREQTIVVNNQECSIE